ncbi:zinc finger protein 827-like [Xiphophorus maculatus]|uniref:Zinc finger protein 827-like n=1 Tax=Xiphophorus maculatus TaxID=8083 RepID=A0A3B5RBH2_XIPMA|nr:zinc finger protein 827-like [Xiphophorus maculatus]XP_023202692.1 zinc finger protein 827-like [Xiphophorus maculatus]
MKRGSSVLQPPSDAAKRHTHPALTKTHSGDEALSMSVCDARAAGSSPFPAATSLFSPDVSTKMASDLLIRLSEATQKAQMHPGSQEEAEQQDEPGVALSPDGPGASPEPPSLTHTPEGNAVTDTLASDLLRKLAERQDVSGHMLRLKEEEEPLEVDAMTPSQLVVKETTHSTLRMTNHHLFNVKPENQFLTRNNPAEQLHPGANMVDQYSFGLNAGDGFSSSHPADCFLNASNGFQFQVKLEDCSAPETAVEDLLHPRAKMDNLRPVNAKISEKPFNGAKMSNKFFSGITKESQFPSAAMLENGVVSGAKMAAQVFSGAKIEEHFLFGAKMEDECLRAVLWQDMSVNLASTLLHQLSEKVSKSSCQQVERMAPPIRSSPALKINMDHVPSSPLLSPRETLHEMQTSIVRDQTSGSSYFFRCHVCGFETEGHALFKSHMTEHRQWEHGSFSLHCCRCDHSTNQEAEMMAHVDTHVHCDTGEMRRPAPLPAAPSRALPVAVATQPEQSTSEHRCRICQRSFPGQPELLAHFQGHRQGNQYRCDRCGHLTRTANKLVEHVRVHTGERPFTCDLCPYSAKRRDSLRLHCKVKHANANASANAGVNADVHTHRTYAPHGDGQRSSKHVRRLHTASSLPRPAAPPLPALQPLLSDCTGWRDLSPLLPITTLISLKPRSYFSSCSSSSPHCSNKHSFLGYLGLTSL